MADIVHDPVPCHHELSSRDPRAVDPVARAALDALGMKLPASFVEWFAMVDGAELLRQHSNCDDPIPIADLEANLAILPFMNENQGVCRWGVRLDGGDDPPVMVAVDPEFAWREVCSTFSTFIACQVHDRRDVLDARRLLAAQDDPLAPADLAFLRANFVEDRTRAAGRLTINIASPTSSAASSSGPASIKATGGWRPMMTSASRSSPGSSGRVVTCASRCTAQEPTEKPCSRASVAELYPLITLRSSLTFVYEMKKASVLSIARQPSAFMRFLRDKNAPVLPRVLALFAVLYVVMPFDLIPDVIPVIGWLDDIGVVALVVAWTASQVRKYAAQPAIAVSRS